MTIHRIDFAIDLLGPIARVCGAVARFAPRDRDRRRQAVPALGCRRLVVPDRRVRQRRDRRLGGDDAGQGLSPRRLRPRMGRDQRLGGSAVYRLHEPNTILLGKTGHDLAPVPVPAEFLKPADSPRDPAEGAPATVFRYDLMWEFISAIVEQRPAVPSFFDGLNAQLVADAVLESHAKRTWIEIPPPRP